MRSLSLLISAFAALFSVAFALNARTNSRAIQADATNSVSKDLLVSPVKGSAKPESKGPKVPDFPPVSKYCEDTRHATRFPSQDVFVGKVKLGSKNKIACQTMTTSDTKNVTASVEQVIRVSKAGADIVRLTVQGLGEAKACKKIRQELFDRGYDIPLVADIHFSPKVGMAVADAFEKIRVNPGNFADGAKSFEEEVFDTYEDFLKGRVKIEELFTPLVKKAKEMGRAIRIGTNHGSLSARILSYYGDTPRGMVESAKEFAEICRKNDFHNFVFSMKASNPIVMVQAYRLLVAEQYRMGWRYPIHLGVTEAGEGEDGRIKSAIGIGALLSDGIGDTIRVSLTEDPWLELGPCTKLAAYGMEKSSAKRAEEDKVPYYEETTRDFQVFSRRETALPCQLESDPVDVRGYMHRDGSVFMPITIRQLRNPDKLYKALGAKLSVGMPFKDIATADSIVLNEVPPVEDKAARLTIKRLQEASIGVLAPASQLEHSPIPNAVALFTLTDVSKMVKGEGFMGVKGGIKMPGGALRIGVTIEGDEADEVLMSLFEIPADQTPMVILLKIKKGVSRLHASRRVFEHLKRKGSKIPVIHHLTFDDDIDLEDMVIRSAFDIGALLVDGLGEGIIIEGPHPTDAVRSIGFNILQGCRMRTTKTEFISCPSCGRTLFDLQEVTDQIRRRTGHLPGVAIAVMGCIVNGPGEMADADFGYVGGAPGKVDLYVGKALVQRGIPNDVACDKLVQLIKDHGKWVDPPADEQAVKAA